MAASVTMAKPKRAVRAVFISMLIVDFEASPRNLGFGKDMQNEITRHLERTGVEVKRKT